MRASPTNRTMWTVSASFCAPGDLDLPSRPLAFSHPFLTGSLLVRSYTITGIFTFLLGGAIRRILKYTTDIHFVAASVKLKLQARTNCIP